MTYGSAYTTEIPADTATDSYAEDTSRSYAEDSSRDNAPPPVDPNSVLINVVVPPDAELWFDGQKTSQKGRFRQFETPSLDPGHDYNYDVKARWKQGGQEFNQARSLSVRAGDRLIVNFTKPSGPKTSGPEKVRPPRPVSP